jgi:NDP-sugar pyrophosphorylase family protein
MILCAGLGTRLRPVTNTIHKCLMPLMDRPIVEHIFDRLLRIGITEYVVNTHYLAGQVREEISRMAWGRFDVAFSHEPEILGPVGGIRKALPLLGDEPFLVVNGDIAADADIECIMRSHCESGAALTMGVLPGDRRPELAAVGYDADGRVRSLWGKPEWSGVQSKGINIGIFIYEPSVLERYAPDGVFYDFRTELIPKMFENDDKVIACPVDGYWNDIGTLESYLGAHRDLFEGRAPGIFRASDDMAIAGAEIRHPVLILPGAGIEKGVEIGPYVVAHPECKVGAGAKVRNSVLLPGSNVAEGSVVERQVVVGE